MAEESDKREKIIQAATGLFARHGLKKTTVDEIAEAAGVGKGTIYLYYASKDEIFSAAIRREGRQLMRRVRSAVRKEESAVDQLHSYVRARFRAVNDLLVLHQVASGVLQEARPVLGEAAAGFLQIERAIIEDILEGGVERGELEVDDIPLVSLAISSTVRALEEPWLYEGRDLRLEEKGELLVDLIVRGLEKRG